jgi:hypothetical protein
MTSVICCTIREHSRHSRATTGFLIELIILSILFILSNNWSAAMSNLPSSSRRNFLQSSALGFGSLALGALCNDQAIAASPLATRASHFKPRAKRVIFLFMQGGPSHVDLFDYKPRLAKESGNTLPFKLPETEATVGLDNTRLLGPISKFSHHGDSGLYMSDLLPHTARHADDLCVLRAMQSDSPNHPVAVRMLHTGISNGYLPAMGSWLSYGLGTENQQLPSYITILPGEGERNYSSAFLPAIHQGTPIQEVGAKPGKAPIRYLTDSQISPELQRKRIDLLQKMNRRQLARLERDAHVEGVIESFEIAFRMQAQTPALIDLSSESKATKDLYGIDQQPTDQFGRQCLLARRFAEAGVRFVQVSMNGWDHHGDIATGLPRECATADKPVAGLLSDLKQRGMLDDTLVVWAGEFGRTPHSHRRRAEIRRSETHALAGGYSVPRYRRRHAARRSGDRWLRPRQLRPGRPKPRRIRNRLRSAQRQESLGGPHARRDSRRVGRRGRESYLSRSQRRARRVGPGRREGALAEPRE